ncbi:MMPL family transporter [Pasteurella atlantica]|uniref:MMPL family transporter n=1 Tax=Pasteurellaceae TaxID=712 RepID=UPI002764364F|nr:hypothetical protein [Pasteurella atlantica]MDP8098902.1 hypothetical protein [Pasteurella atlantica]MDP8106929.1 hypothetical protein [Pasteurella atlantica]MDP8116619.1 hypothetical protein [Pasteurella atlantica]
MKNHTAYRYLYSLFIIVVLIFFAFSVKNGHWLETDLKALLPTNQSWTTEQKQADALQEKQLNQQIVALVGGDDHSVFKTAEQIAQLWQKSQLFSDVNLKTTPDLAKLRKEVNYLKLATLPKHIQQQLQQNPQAYFNQYAQQIVDPFSQNNILSLEQDWLGLGRFVLPQSQISSAVQYNSENGMLYAKQSHKTWVLLHATLTQHSFINPNKTLLTLIKQSEQLAQTQKAQFISTGSALFAANAKQQAETEMTLMSSLGISLTLLLLLVVFRSFRSLWLFLPIGIGLLLGIATTVLWFGQIHILTIVIGTSLIGVLIDFPLHWLASSRFYKNWNAQQEMNKLRFPFFISLIITLIGYLLLAFTSLPVLQQTAIFSAMALVSAILGTVLFLPTFFTNYQAHKRSFLLQNLPISIPTKIEKMGLIFAIIFVAVGIYKSKWQDDIRQWVALPPAMLQQAQQIATITGFNFGSQYLLIIADNDDDLLQKDQKLTEQLAQLVKEKSITHFQSLTQWITTAHTQQKIAEQFTQIKPQDYAIFEQIGIPLENIQKAIATLKQTPVVSLSQALNTDLGKARRTLYLGKLDTQKVASIIKISNLQNIQKILPLTNDKDIFWQDKRASLNMAFEQTRDQAAWLKLCSFILAFLLLYPFFKLKSTTQILAIPLSAIIITVGIFGWLAIPISLFTMFGLLLVSAIGIDYTSYMLTVKESFKQKAFAISLAGTTTLISFILLGLSSTPAVASFGMSVSIGIAMSILITLRILK